MATIDDIALAVGVARSTVSRVLNGRETRVPVSQATRERILAVAGELRYHPNLFARGLRTKRSRIVGIAVRDFANPFWSGLVEGIVQACSERGYHPILHNVAHEREEEETASVLVSQVGVDALLLVGDFPSDVATAERIARRCPVAVALCRDLEPTIAPRITIDDRRGLWLVMRHLSGLGHRRIGYIGLSRPRGFADRHAAYRDFLIRQELPVAEPLVALVDVDDQDFPSEDQLIQLGTDAARRVLASGEAIDALVCANDAMALGALQAAKQAGLAVPGDVSITGFDNASLGRWCSPSLTTIHHPVAEMGRAAAALAIDLVEAVVARPVEPILFAPELVVRESTAPPSVRPG
jgi:DNA-binding LacI/PurR family transcriptional regulator